MKKAYVASGLAAAAIALFAASAFAGEKNHITVELNTTTRTAYGSMGDARASSDSAQYIGCSLSENGGVLTGLCEVEDSGQHTASCYIPSAQLNAFAQVLATQTTAAYFYFQWNASGQCTYVYSSSESVWTPMVP